MSEAPKAPPRLRVRVQPDAFTTATTTTPTMSPVAPEVLSEHRGGYRCPPPRTRWQKGQSGNPAGRRKRPKTLLEDLHERMQKKVTYTSGGARKTATRQGLLLETQIDRALKGEEKAANRLITLLRLPLTEAGELEGWRILSGAEKAALLAPEAREKLLAGLEAWKEGGDDDS